MDNQEYQAVELKINDKFKNLIPPLTDEEFRQLEANCTEQGIQDAIVVWNGVIIDGHNRYKIAQRNGLSFKTREVEFSTEDEAVRYIYNLQLGRRNLNTYQKAVAALELSEIVKDVGKQGRRNDLAKDYQNIPPHSGGSSDKKKTNRENETDRKLATIAKTAHSTISKVKRIEQDASPEIKEAARNGDISINKAYTETMAALHPKQPTRQEIIEGLKQDVEAKRQEIEQDKESGIVDISKVRTQKKDEAIVAKFAACENRKLLDKAIESLSEFLKLPDNEIMDALRLAYDLTVLKSDYAQFAKDTGKILSRMEAVIAGRK